MLYIGKIDRKIYSCISSNIVTDEVIITDERIDHIKIGHKNDYEQFSQYFEEIIKYPDYILEANREKTAVILKEIEKDDKKFKLILRLVTSTDDSSFKNSIITFMKISEKDWVRLIKNKKILYKRV